MEQNKKNFLKSEFTELKDKFTITVRDFNISFSVIDKIARHTHTNMRIQNTLTT